MGINNEYYVKAFTDGLYELVVEQKVSLTKSLEIMEFEKKSVMQKACKKIREELLAGNSFSIALQSCAVINFDAVYISFICFSELTGNFQETISFLKQRCERKEVTSLKLIEAALYPAFIVVLALGISVFLGYYNHSLAADYAIAVNTPGNQKLYFAILLLLAVCAITFLLLRKNLSENKLYESFLAISFLINSGVSASMAVGAGIIIAGPESKYGILFQKAKEKLEFGMDVYSAFDNFHLGKELRNAFYYAHMAGHKADIFEKIATRMGASDEKRKRRCLSLVEPMFIGITGMFLMVILVSYLMPMITNLNWLL